MTDATFQQAYRFVLHGDTPKPGKPKLWAGEKGKHLPTRADPHPTLDGVIQDTYDAYRDRLGQARQSVLLMEPEEREAIYRDFWHQSHAGKLEAMGKTRLAICHYTTFFNLPPAAANKILQRAIGATADGVVGPNTLDAAARADDLQAAVRYCGQLVRYYKQIASDGGPDDRHAPNLNGWLLRVTAIQKEVGL